MEKEGYLLGFLLLSVFVLFGCAAQEAPVEKVSEPIANVPEAEPELVPETPQDLIPEINNMPTEPVAGTLSFSWEKDVGSRIVDGSVPFVHGLKDGKVRLYYCNNKGILSAISNDGLTFAKESGVRISPGTGFEFQVCDPTIVNLPDGKMRMYYKGANSLNPGPGQ